MRRNRPGLGIGLMVVAGLMLTASDATTKLLTEGLSVAEVLLAKSLFTLVLLLVLASAVGPRRMFHVVNWQGQVLRALLSIVSTFLFVFGLNVLPLSTAVMLSFAGPLFVTLLAPWLLGEYVDARRWAAVVAGFAGVAIIASPSAGDFSFFLLLPLGAALCSSLRDMLTRSIAAHETSESMVFYSLLGVALAGLVASWADLTIISIREWWLIAAASVTNVTALYLMVESVRNAETAAVAPFKYCNLIWVTVLEVAIWAQFPRWNVLLGAGVIVAAMLYILHSARGAQRGVQAEATLGSAVAASGSPDPSSQESTPIGNDRHPA